MVCGRTEHLVFHKWKTPPSYDCIMMICLSWSKYCATESDSPSLMLKVCMILHAFFYFSYVWNSIFQIFFRYSCDSFGHFTLLPSCHSCRYPWRFVAGFPGFCVSIKTWAHYSRSLWGKKTRMTGRRIFPKLEIRPSPNPVERREGKEVIRAEIPGRKCMQVMLRWMRPWATLQSSCALAYRGSIWQRF